MSTMSHDFLQSLLTLEPLYHGDLVYCPPFWARDEREATEWMEPPNEDCLQQKWRQLGFLCVQ